MKTNDATGKKRHLIFNAGKLLCCFDAATVCMEIINYFIIFTRIIY